MQKDKKQFMDLNHETAMRLWNKQFGKETKVKDFTGREISKGAYNQRGSEYGWNVDHILPQSQGGKTVDYNLICCHIKTNDEKADKFPCFVANSKKFEIIKVENHYEIHLVSKSEKKEIPEDDLSVNFYDSASGIRFFKKLKGIQNKPRFVGSILIRLKNVGNTAVIDFIEKFLDEENISYSMNQDYRNAETRIIARNYNMPSRDDISNLLDKCILLNTYLGHYFMEAEYVNSYDIYFRVDCFKEKSQMYVESQNITFEKILGKGKNGYYGYSELIVPFSGTMANSQLHNTLFINNLVYINTEAQDKEPDLDFTYDEYQQYNYIFTKLADNLKKEVER